MDAQISVATVNDIPQLLPLVNSAYRGDQARSGWTHEADLIDGELRIDEFSLTQLIQKQHSVILKYLQPDKIIGCVYLEKQDNKLYLGMLSVNPELQAKGIGKKLLKAAEEYAINNSCHLIEMTVITVRHELIAWYERNGYVKTGKTKPFQEDSKFGVPLRRLEFVVMEKKMRSGE
jgi:ribosomal protein S18 acetylase RimI-like enzyme